MANKQYFSVSDEFISFFIEPPGETPKRFIILNPIAVINIKVIRFRIMNLIVGFGQLPKSYQY